MLLDYRNQPERGNPTGWRVDDDGRVEQLSDRDESVGIAGELTGKSVPLEWREEFRLDADGLDSLREAIRSALQHVDRDHYGAEAHVSHARRLTWRLEAGGKEREIVVDGFPSVKVPALDDLLQKLLRMRLRDEGPVSSRWTWQTAAGEHSREFPGEPAEVPELAPLLRLALPTGSSSSAAGEPPGGPPVLAIQWLEGGEAGDSLTIYPDGRRILIEGRSGRDASPLSSDELAELLEALKQLPG